MSLEKVIKCRLRTYSCILSELLLCNLGTQSRNIFHLRVIVDCQGRLPVIAHCELCGKVSACPAGIHSNLPGHFIRERCSLQQCFPSRLIKSGLCLLEPVLCLH